jgi:hypothetical protein
MGCFSAVIGIMVAVKLMTGVYHGKMAVLKRGLGAMKLSADLIFHAIVYLVCICFKHPVEDVSDII